MNLFRSLLVWIALVLLGNSGCKQESEFGVLVSAHWLEDQMKNPSLVLLHVGNEEVYDSIHIPGARYLDPYAFTFTTDSLRNEIPELDSITDLLRSVGVNMNSRIVLYYEDENLITRTTRVFLALDYAGLGDRTHVLNGGLPGWEEEDGETTDLLPEISEGDLSLNRSRNVIIRAHELNQQRWNPEYVLIDVRSPGEYYGELDSTGLNPTGGHIEGAYYMPYGIMLSDSVPYQFKDNNALKKEFDKIGMDPDKTTIYYCGSGMRASVTYLAARHLGYPVKLYDGSSQEWEKLELPLTSPAIDPLDDP